MHPEFKAYVEAVCETADQVQPSRVTRHSDRAVKPIATKKNFFTFIADLLDEFPPYYCELKMLPKTNKSRNCCSSRRDAIGYHGLI